VVCNEPHEVGIESNRRLERDGEVLTWCCTYCPSHSGKKGYIKKKLKWFFEYSLFDWDEVVAKLL
jgi:hypothetical protein